MSQIVVTFDKPLFIYLLSISSKSTKLNLLSYADDTTVYLSGTDMVSVVNTINRELNNIYVWLCENRFTVRDPFSDK